MKVNNLYDKEIYSESCRYKKLGEKGVKEALVENERFGVADSIFNEKEQLRKADGKKIGTEKKAV